MHVATGINSKSNGIAHSNTVINTCFSVEDGQREKYYCYHTRCFYSFASPETLFFSQCFRRGGQWMRVCCGGTSPADYLLSPWALTLTSPPGSPARETCSYCENFGPLALPSPLSLKRPLGEFWHLRISRTPSKVDRGSMSRRLLRLQRRRGLENSKWHSRNRKRWVTERKVGPGGAEEASRPSILK